MTGTYSKNSDVVFRRIADEYLLIPVRQRAVDLKSIYTLNDAAAFIWELIDGKRTVSQMTDRLAKEFEVEAPQAGSDVAGLLSHLEALGFIMPT